MKILLTAIITLIISNYSFAQINVGPLELVKMNPGNFSKEALTKFKSSKTVFVYRENDDIAKLELAIKEVWKVTEISFVAFSKMNTINLENTSIFSIRGVNTTTSNMSSGMNYDNTHIYLSLWMQGKSNKGKNTTEFYSRVELHPTSVDYSKVTGSRSKDALEYLYNDGQLKNWNVGFLKIYLKNVNDLLTDETERWLFQTDKKNPEAKKLQTKTLYVPNYALVDYAMMTGDESKRLEEDNIFKSYPYKYELIDSDELSKKIIDSKEPFYYMVYTKSSTDKYITVYNSQTGAIVYSKYKPLSYNLKDSDLKDLAKSVK